ncbi:hypothetical protein V6Z96_001566 [Aspergillus fumigatus]
MYRQKPEAATQAGSTGGRGIFFYSGTHTTCLRFLPPLLQCLLSPIRRASSTLLILRHEVVLVNPRFKFTISPLKPSFLPLRSHRSSFSCQISRLFGHSRFPSALGPSNITLASISLRFFKVRSEQ